MSVRSFRDLRAWQAARAFKIAVYALTDAGTLVRDERLRSQLREAAASAASNISEGFGRFDPVDFGRFLKMARASIIECQNHLQDAVDRRHIADDVRQAHDTLAQTALMEIGGLLDYLQSPEATANARRIKESRFERRRQRVANQKSPNQEPGTVNPEPEPEPEPEQERSTRTRTLDPGTRN